MSWSQHYRPFFYPLDALLEWNRMYGPRGFYQYQCAVPDGARAARVRALLETISASGLGSFLAVLKQFGDCLTRPAVVSNARYHAGAGLSQSWRETASAVRHVGPIVLDAGGRLYPAKDGRMGAAIFKAGYPRWREFTHTSIRASRRRSGAESWARRRAPEARTAHPPATPFRPLPRRGRTA